MLDRAGCRTWRLEVPVGLNFIASDGYDTGKPDPTVRAEELRMVHDMANEPAIITGNPCQ
jgi:hypothetical protein